MGEGRDFKPTGVGRGVGDSVEMGRVRETGSESVSKPKGSRGSGATKIDDEEEDLSVVGEECLLGRRE